MKKVTAFSLGAFGALAVACGVTEGEVLVARDAGPAPAEDASTLDATSPVDARIPDSSPDVTDAADACTGLDFTSDSHNCGACGHDCLGGPCANGTCGVVVLATGTGTGIAINDTRVYWADADLDGGILSVAKDGSHPLTIATGQAAPVGIFADDTNVIWTDISNGAIWRANTDGSNPFALYTPDHTGGRGIVADATNVYWAATYQGEIFSEPRAGVPDGGLPTILAGSGTYAWGVAQDATNFYWADEGGYPVMQSSPPGSIMSVPKDGSGPAQMVAGGQVDPRFMAADVTGVYWTDPGAGTALRLTPGAAQPQVLFTGEQPFGIALDATYLYLSTIGTDNSDGTVVRLPKDGSGTPFVMANGLSYPSEVAVDDVAVYWANQAGGGIMKVAK
jgi:hypothetical protein